MDLNGDGHDDMISGSYWPGHITVFEGQGSAKFAKGYELANRDGTKLHAGPPWKKKNEPERDSLASAPHAIDWDGDGDYDLLVGNISGRVILIRNEGTKQKPAFSTERTAILADSEPIRVPGGDAGPTSADWDRDGLVDLIVGAGDGSVWLFRNTGTKTAPKLVAGHKLLDKSPLGFSAIDSDESPKWHGARAKVCICDYNGDGLLDILAGGRTSVKYPQPKLTKAQFKRRRELRKQRTAISRERSKVYRKYKNNLDQYRKLTKDLNARSISVHRELRKLEPKRETQGWVWVHLQKKTAKPSGSAPR